MSQTGRDILIVDDDTSIQELLRIILTKHGYTVHQATNGEEAIHRYMEVDPDLVISDISMPKGDGFNVAIIIRSKERDGKNIPILLISAFYDDHANVKNAERCGASAFLPKPFTQKQLMDAVESLLRNGND
ncbi:MAG: response regulator [bacterium]|nr:response regulator [bacterium]MDT8396565.1 response regulator [bacterium]